MLCYQKEDLLIIRHKEQPLSTICQLFSHRKASFKEVKAIGKKETHILLKVTNYYGFLCL